ncbi:hypothetical protein NDU88_000821 [Pleurodeles waltl]|uniref:Uncharacterized protein n=1 Tax=Pleurodeles waltl TaxID=8319 RepID=A0AAV7Q296_PLEWA|nr:hypothetical protein NDU88_000821 [Pleurodeles waltl]
MKSDASATSIRLHERGFVNNRNAVHPKTFFGADQIAFDRIMRLQESCVGVVVWVTEAIRASSGGEQLVRAVENSVLFSRRGGSPEQYRRHGIVASYSQELHRIAHLRRVRLGSMTKSAKNSIHRTYNKNEHVKRWRASRGLQPPAGPGASRGPGLERSGAETSPHGVTHGPVCGRREQRARSPGGHQERGVHSVQGFRGATDEDRMVSYSASANNRVTCSWGSHSKREKTHTLHTPAAALHERCTGPCVGVTYDVIRTCRARGAGRPG